MKRWLPVLALGACVALATSAQEAGVSLQVLKYDGFSKLVEQQRGKVLYIDFWADF